MTTQETPKHDALVAELKNRFGPKILDVDRTFDDCTAIVDKGAIHDVLAYLKNERRFNLLLDVAGVDRMNLSKFRERFEVVYVLYSIPDDLRLRLEVPVSELDYERSHGHRSVEVGNWAEREAFEMFGFTRRAPVLEALAHASRVRRAPAAQGLPAHGWSVVRHHSDMTEELERAALMAKNYNIQDFVPKEAPAPYSSRDFDGDVDLTRDDFNEGLELPDINTTPMFINIGPSHPATHGTFRVYAQLEGEMVEKAGVDVGYLHRGFEKIVEIKQYNQIIPYTDRLNYCSGLVNNVAFCKAVSA